jgi:protein O-GlcNAc transferase
VSNRRAALRNVPPQTPSWMQDKPGQRPFWEQPEQMLVRPPRLTQEQKQVNELMSQAIMLMQFRQYPSALPLIERAAGIAPTNAEILYHLGCCFLEMGDNANASRRFEQTLQFRPKWAEALNNLSAAYARMGMVDESIKAAEASIAVKPTAPAYANLSAAYGSMGRTEDAITAGEHAVGIDAKSAMAWTNLAVAYRGAWRLDDAVRAVETAISCDPSNYMPWSNMGAFKNLQGKIPEAIAFTEEAMTRAMYLPVVRANWIMYLDLDPSTTLIEALSARRSWAYLFETPMKRFRRPHTNTVDSARKLKIGYVGSDFRQHSAAHNHGPIIRAHDPEQFEVYIYAGNAIEDHISAWIKEAPALVSWVNTSRLSDPQLAEKIREDGIDILVDVAGFTAGGRLQTFACKPAPLQVCAWGYANGTGLESMDAFFADPVLVPEGYEVGYKESIVRLPCVIPFDPYLELPPPTAPPKAKNGYVTFGSFNRVEKISEPILWLWSEVLKAVPDSKMLFKFGGLEGGTAEYLREQFTKHGIDLERLDIRGHTPRDEHLRAFGEVDIMLDAWPHGGGVTTCEAAYLGVPTVALMGERAPSRVSGAILSVLGLQDWIAENPQQYKEIAVTKAGEDLSALRMGLPETMRRSVIGDVKQYTGAVEVAYRELWRMWCDRQPRGEATEAA